jgi:K+-sensing histidine kinase KdpD
MILRDVCVLIQDPFKPAIFNEVFPSLSTVPAEYRSGQHFSLFGRAKPGWTRISEAVTAFCSAIEGGRRLIVVCMMRRAQENSVDGQRLLQYAEKLAALVRGLTEVGRLESDTAFQHLSHDLRRIGASQAAAGAAATRFLDMNPANIAEARVRIKNMTELQQLLSVRLEMTDGIFSREDLTEYKGSNVKTRIFQAFEKIQMAFLPLAYEKSVFFDHVGNSFGSAMAPLFFRVVPFAIIDNAVKYSPKGERISLEFSESPTDINVTVRSKGPLIKEEELELLFERGYRAQSAKSSQGSGLGLYIVRRIIHELCDGTVTATSNGADPLASEVCFRIRLPRTL